VNLRQFLHDLVEELSEDRIKVGLHTHIDRVDDASLPTALLGLRVLLRTFTADNSGAHRSGTT
jgi:hypothetical protein